jgi:adenosylcobinamide kinase / adenosylcobinamide-phosphate guanylyltransferase
MKLILVLGGVRSGKSHFAEKWATRRAVGKPVLYLATGEATDEEMAERIDRHRAERPEHWLTMESPLYVTEAVQNAPVTPVVLLDCLTLLSSNWLLSDENSDQETALKAELQSLLAHLARTETCLVVVSNEVGMGIVPAYALGRRYRDMLGRLNQWLASQADLVYLMVAGLPIEVTALAEHGWAD